MRRIPERLRARLRHIVGADEEPARLAAAWAVGIAISFSPFLGLHLVIALVLAWLFRLNKVDVVLGTLFINPWTLTLYFPLAVMTGRLVTGVRVPAIVLPHPAELLDADVWRRQAAWLKPLLVSWTVGGTLIALCVGAITYFALRRLIERHRERHPRPARAA